MSHQINFDPYKVLQIDRRASMQDVKKVYYALSKKYHPDRGGNEEMFRIITQAYQVIIGKVDQTGRRRGHREDDLEVTMKGSLSKDNFSLSRFNQEFSNHRKIGVDYVYDIDPSMGHTDRNLGDYRRERDDLETIKPLFNKGAGFDPNVFNRMFDHLKNENEANDRSLVAHQQPQALVSQNQIQFSNVNPHASQVTQYLATGNLNEGFANLNGDGSFRNPDTLSRDEFLRLQSKPDVTRRDAALSKGEMRQRMNDYQANSHYTIPKGGQRPPTGDVPVGELDPFYHVQDNPSMMITYENEDVGMGELMTPQIEYLPQAQAPPRPQNTHQRRGPQQTANRLDPFPKHSNPLLPTQEISEFDPRMEQRGMPRTPQGGVSRNGLPRNQGYHQNQPNRQQMFKPNYEVMQPVRQGEQPNRMMEPPRPETYYGRTSNYPTNPNVAGDDTVRSLEKRMEEMARKMNLQDKLLRKMNKKNQELKQKIKEGDRY